MANEYLPLKQIPGGTSNDVPVRPEYVAMSKADLERVATQQALWIEALERQNATSALEIMRLNNEVAQLIMENRELKAEARFDSVTGIYNRNGAIKTLPDLIREALRNDQVLVAFMLDGNGMKDINDTQGHEAGDNALKKVAANIRNTTHKSDLAARLGGDEFFVVCAVDRANAYEAGAQIGIRLCQNIAANSGGLTVSCGYTTLDPLTIAEPGVPGKPKYSVISDAAIIETIPQLFKRADLGMYMIKRSVKNGVYYMPFKNSRSDPRGPHQVWPKNDILPEPAAPLTKQIPLNFGELVPA
jgi:diguanylate cyclase (GGDEF)-like protein